MADKIDDRWTVRGISVETKKAAAAAADRQRMSQGEWVTLAIMEKIAADQAPPVTQQAPGGPSADLDEARSIVAMIGELSGSGAEVPQTVARAAYGLLEARLQAIRKQGKAAG